MDIKVPEAGNLPHNLREGLGVPEDRCKVKENAVHKKWKRLDEANLWQL